MESEQEAGMAIRVFKVPKEFKLPYGVEYLCEHLCEKVMNGGTVEAKEIGFNGTHNDGADYGVVLCLACEKRRKETRYPPYQFMPLPIDKIPLFKDLMKK